MSDGFPPEWRPDESSADIFAEHTWLQGAFLGAIAFGIEFILYVMTCFFLWKLRTPINNRQNLFFIFYITVIFTLSVLYVAGLFQFTQLSFIDGRNIPGGPAQFENVMFSLPIDMLANVIMVLNSWLCDIINVWRCFVIYKGCRVPSWVVNMIPILLYFGSVAFGILFLKQVGTVSQSPWDSSGINFTIPYYAMSLALNIIITILIVLRLLVYRHRIVKAMGKGHGSQYTSLAAIIVESAAIYSTFALLFLIPFALNSPVSQLFLQGLSMVQGLSTFLIIFRVATGKGWSSDTYARTMQTSTLAIRAVGGSTKAPSRKRSAPTSNVLSSNVLSSFSKEDESRDDPIVLGTITSTESSDWSSAKKSTNNIEISKHILVEQSEV
ncbi:hypothetical protein AN958_02221 [Leucoagaricus sp. SymC.cos]|nr:hypothetical protein AN958_02221 [Leucoagaricus sp. SymC.cos]